MKFIADSELGRLAKRLRLLGYDTLYYPQIEDSLLLRKSREENRIILTRDKSLMKRRDIKRCRCEALYIKNEQVFSQIKQILYLFRIKPDFSKSRCKHDNGELKRIEKKEVKNKVPEYVYKNQNEFVICKNCKRLYWKATQWEKLKKDIEML